MLLRLLATSALPGAVVTTAPFLLIQNNKAGLLQATAIAVKPAKLIIQMEKVRSTWLSK